MQGAAIAAQRARVEALLTQASWLTGPQERLVNSFLSRLTDTAPRRLSPRQLEVVADIEARVESRQEPHLVHGGLPGGGRRR